MQFFSVVFIKWKPFLGPMPQKVTFILLNILCGLWQHTSPNGCPHWLSQLQLDKLLLGLPQQNKWEFSWRERPESSNFQSWGSTGEPFQQGYKWRSCTKIALQYKSYGLMLLEL